MSPEAERYRRGHMKFIKNTIHFILFFLVIEMIALSAVALSFYESLQNALKQEAILSDHRARDLVLALAKSSELRLQKEGFIELDKMFKRYVEKTNSDPEKFKIEDITLYSNEAVVLVSTKPEFLIGISNESKADKTVLESDYFRKGLRMKKWEWSSPEESENQVSSIPPETNEMFQWVLKYVPLANKNTVRITTPLYKPNSLDVTGLIVFTYERGNMSLLFTNQLSLVSWMAVNYTLIALIVSLMLTGLFFIFQMIYDSKEVPNQEGDLSKKMEKDLPLMEVKTLGSPESSVEKWEDPQESDHFNGSAEEVTENDNQSKVLDAIYLG